MAYLISDIHCFGHFNFCNKHCTSRFFSHYYFFKQLFSSGTALNILSKRHDCSLLGWPLLKIPETNKSSFNLCTLNNFIVIPDISRFYREAWNSIKQLLSRTRLIDPALTAASHTLTHSTHSHTSTHTSSNQPNTEHKKKNRWNLNISTKAHGIANFTITVSRTAGATE